MSDLVKPSDQVEGSKSATKRRALDAAVAQRSDVVKPLGATTLDTAHVENNIGGRNLHVAKRIEMNTRLKAAEQAHLSKTQLNNIRLETAGALSAPEQNSHTHRDAYERKYRGLIAEKALAAEGGVALNDVKHNTPVYDHLFYKESASVKTHLENQGRPNQHLAAYAHDLRVAIGATEAKAGKYAGKSGPSFAASELKHVEIPGFDTSHAGPRELEKYLKDTASVRIPSDHVDGVKAYVAERAAENPTLYGLNSRYSRADMNALLDRVKPIPIRSDQIASAANLQANNLFGA